jgi:polysaccharide biosynthesis protein PslG
MAVCCAVVTGCTSGESEGARPAPPVLAVVVEPLPPIGAIEPSFIGLHDHDAVDSWPSVPFGSYRAWDAGVTWRDIETAPGAYDFTRVDDIVDTAEEHNADVLLVLGQTPPFHAENPEAESFYGAGAASPPDLVAWQAYVRALATRYAGRDVAYQVWNEANVLGFWSGSPGQLAKLTAVTAQVLDTVSPRPTMVAPAMATRLIGQRAFFADFYARKVFGAPVASYMDVVSLQLYPEADAGPAESMHLLESMRVRMAELYVDKPIWNTEINYGVSGAVDVAPDAVAEQQAKVAQTLLLNAARGVDRVYWYGWDQQGLVDTLLTESDGVTQAPGGRTLEVVSEWLVGGVLESCEPDAAGTYTCVLRRTDRNFIVYWNPTTPATVPIPTGATRAEKADGTPIATDGAELAVAAVPVMVEVPSG